MQIDINFQFRLRFIQQQSNLGEEKDPMQTEAESLIGATLIKEPRKFSEPRPYSIRIDNTPIFDYIELGASEILEDKSVIVTNEKQQSPLIISDWYFMCIPIMSVFL
mgnify:CR=1 FL=1